MSRTFSIVSRHELGETAWDELCAGREDAWLFHTSRWFPVLGIADASFAVVDRAGTPLSLVGIASPTNETGEEVWLSNLRAGIAHIDGLPEGLRHELDEAALSEVHRLAASSGALRVDWELPSMPPGADGLLPALMASGYECHVWPSKVVDLTLDEEALWRDYRKGCKSVIRRAQKLGVTTTDVTDESGAAAFADLHARRMRAIGAASPAEDVFTEMWRQLTPAGHCEILLAHLPSGTLVAGIILLSYKDEVYYHAACSDPAHMETGGNTLLVHEALTRAKTRGARLFHLGPTPLASQVSEKVHLVGRFKNQFGGNERTWVMASLVLRQATPEPVSRGRRRVRGRVAAVLPPGIKRRLRDLVSSR